MSNDDFYTATSSWTAIEANGADITNGIFTIVGTRSQTVFLFKATTTPNEEVGPLLLQGKGVSVDYALNDGEYLYCKTNEGSGVSIGVIQKNSDVPISIKNGEISTLNSSTTPLTGSATYTGTGEVVVYPDAMVVVQTDAAGTVYFDFSIDDGSNYSPFPVNGFKCAAGINEFHTVVKGRRKFRVRYVNDADAQTYFRLYTEYGTYRQGNTPLNQSIGLDADATLSRSTITQDEIRVGRRSGVVGFNKFGYRLGLTAAGGAQTVWAASGNFVPMDAADTFDIAFNDTTDGSGTTGATQLAITYIDENGDMQTALHTLGATSPETTAFSGFGINRVAVSANGGLKHNANDIELTDTTGGTTQAFVPALQSVTQQAIYTMGANNDAIAKFLDIKTSKPSGGGNAKILIKGMVYNRQFDTEYEIYRTTQDTSRDLPPPIVDPIGFNLSPTDVLYFTADTDANNVDIVIRFSLNDYQRA